jgi:16S rRNA (cytidine1402-2'-O)-methyltransferase
MLFFRYFVAVVNDMENKGKLFLIPNIIAENTADQSIGPQVRSVLPGISDFLAEDIRTARRYLSSLKIYAAIDKLNFAVLDKDTAEQDLENLMEPIFKGRHIGVISESGCPGIADPGALAVAYAHQNNITVIPLVGPSSILLALMASGLNGQKFAFHGYLPIDPNEISLAIRAFEKESKIKKQTQIFIETPYRNNAILLALTRNLASDTILTIAVDVTGSSEMIRTRAIKAWRQTDLILPKSPAVFLFLA